MHSFAVRPGTAAVMTATERPERKRGSMPSVHSAASSSGDPVGESPGSRTEPAIGTVFRDLEKERRGVCALPRTVQTVSTIQ